MALLLKELADSKRTGVWLYGNRNQNSQTPFCTLDPLLASFASTLFSIPKNIFQGQAVGRGDAAALFKFLLTLQEKFTRVNKESEFTGGIGI
ncbi:MAG: hypothetical protein H6Q41_5406 [Deltaproteobacteria bacterium]|jgi:hypothetical protein|nr:hypothetical protein [Deltaproteobacteria bacterium]